MMDWQTDFKTYVANKLSKVLGYTVDIDSIDNIKINEFDNYNDFIIDDIATLYAFSIMDENYEKANNLLLEFAKRNYTVNIDTDNNTKTALINVVKENELPIIIHMKVLPDGMVIDWGKQNF